MVEQAKLFDDKEYGEYTVENLNPRSTAVKELEMTVLRALQLIEAFDALEEGEDWTDLRGPAIRKILGERYKHAMLLSVCWDRYKNGSLHTQTLDLYNNLPPGAQEREEIKNGIARIRKELDRRGEKSATRRNAGGRRRRGS